MSVYQTDSFDPGSNFCTQLSQPIPISTSYHGRHISGVFSYIDQSKVIVTIKSPYSGLIRGHQTPSFLNSIQNRYIADDRITDKCISTGMSLLIDAYRSAEVLYRNRRQLFHRILIAESRIAVLSEKESVLKTRLEIARDQKNDKQKSRLSNMDEFSAQFQIEQKELAFIEAEKKRIQEQIFIGSRVFPPSNIYEQNAISFIKSYFKEEKV